MWIGLFLVIAGILVLLNNMEILRGDAWDYIWPLFFIMLGISMILKRMRGQEKYNLFPDRPRDENRPNDDRPDQTDYQDPQSGQPRRY